MILANSITWTINYTPAGSPNSGFVFPNFTSSEQPGLGTALTGGTLTMQNLQLHLLLK